MASKRKQSRKPRNEQKMRVIAKLIDLESLYCSESEDQCCHESPYSFARGGKEQPYYVCTRERGHEGFHVAHVAYPISVCCLPWESEQ